MLLMYFSILATFGNSGKTKPKFRESPIDKFFHNAKV